MVWLLSISFTEHDLCLGTVHVHIKKIISKDFLKTQKTFINMLQVAKYPPDSEPLALSPSPISPPYGLKSMNASPYYMHDSSLSCNLKKIFQTQSYFPFISFLHVYCKSWSLIPPSLLHPKTIIFLSFVISTFHYLITLKRSVGFFCHS